MEIKVGSRAFIREAVFTVVGPAQMTGHWILETKAMRTRKAKTIPVTLPRAEVVQGIHDCTIEMAAREFAREEVFTT